ncbi:HeH/LEM domain-containing protein [Pseudomonas caspiana]
MKVIYSDTPGSEPGVCYRLLDEFFGVISSAKEVVVDGDRPNIIEAYQRAGIAVSGPSEKEDEIETDPLKMKVDDLKVWLTGKGIDFPADAKKDELKALVPAE